MRSEADRSLFPAMTGKEYPMDAMMRCWDIMVTVWDMVRSGKRQAEEVARWLQVVKDEPDFVRRLIPASVKHLLDLDADPFVPEGWRGVAENGHRKMGKKVLLERRGDNLYLNGKKIVFYLSESQKNGSIQGFKLREKLSGKEVLNANVLDYLLAHPDLIPESWKKDESGNTRFIYFWGTIYSGSRGDPYVRCLYWLGDRWGWLFRWLDADWHSDGPAVLAS